LNIGWIKLHRSILRNPDWYGEKFSKGQAWADLLLRASHTKSGFNCRGVWVPVNRGQLAVSTEKLAENWRWSRNKVMRYLTALQSKQQIEQQKTNVISVITITNWNRYQSNEAIDGATNGAVDEAANEATERQQKDTFKNVKKDKNEEEGGEVRAKNGCSLSAAKKHFEKTRLETPECDYTEAEVRQAWLDLQSTIDPDGYWVFGKKRIGDFRAALASRIEDNRDRKAKWESSGKPNGGTFSKFESKSGKEKEIDRMLKM
jgi:hypothetical protein